MKRSSALLAATLGLAGCDLALGLGDFKDAEATGAGAPIGGMAPGGSPPTGGGSTGGGGAGPVGGEGGEGAIGPITGHSIAYQVDPLNPDDVSEHRYTDFEETIGAGGAGSELVHVIEAFTPPTDGQWQVYPGSADGLSKFRIDGVPPGPYLLHVDDQFHWMINRENIDLDRYQIEAFDIPRMDAGADPELHLTIGAMTDWKVGDNLQFLVPVKNVYGWLDDFSPLEPPLAAGATSVDATAPYLAVTYSDAIVIPSDPAVFVHSGRRGEDPYQSFVDFAEFGFAATSGAGPVDIHPVVDTSFNPDGQAFDLNIDLGALRSMATKLNPRATPLRETFSYSVLPQPYSVARLSGSLDIVSHTFDQRPASSNLTYVFGNPFDPDRWNPMLIISALPVITYELPGLAPATVDNMFFVNSCEMAPDDPLLPDASSPFAPPLLPPVDARVEGMSFFDLDMPTLASTTPTITWDAPAEAEVDHWDLRAIEVKSNAAGTETRVPFYSGRLMSTFGEARSIAVPPGFLEPEKHYIFAVTGVLCPNCDYDARASRSVLGYCQATVLSEIFDTPAAE